MNPSSSLNCVYSSPIKELQQEKWRNKETRKIRKIIKYVREQWVSNDARSRYRWMQLISYAQSIKYTSICVNNLCKTLTWIEEESCWRTSRWLCWDSGLIFAWESTWTERWLLRREPETCVCPDRPAMTLEPFGQQQEFGQDTFGEFVWIPSSVVLFKTFLLLLSNVSLMKFKKTYQEYTLL